MRIGFPFCAARLLAAALLPSMATVAFAADISVQPASGNGFVVKDASGANERLRVQESGAISLPALAAAATQAQPLCVGSAGLLGLCSGSGSGGSYSAGVGLSLVGSAFSIAPTYQLPQVCAANQLAQWNGTAWSCATIAATGLPAGTANQTLRYDGGNALAATGNLQVMSDGGVLATNAAVNTAIAGGATPTGNIPASGPGVRMMWYPAKGAFRAGYADSTQWDDAKVGLNSIATGLGTIASGNDSTAMGVSTIASGAASFAIGYSATVSGNYSAAIGVSAQANGDESVAMGSGANASGVSSMAMGAASTASGGSSTAIGYGTKASGLGSMAIGYGTAASGDYSTAMGGNADTSQRKNSFVYGDGTKTVLNNRDREFAVLASGGFTFYTGITSQDQSTWPGVALYPGGGSWSQLSDRNSKDALQTVDTRSVLAKVVALPMSTWHYKAQDPVFRHIGPMAQDFHAAFGLGESDKSIDGIDADGVALAAIQGLNAKLTESDVKTSSLLKKKDSEIAQLRADLDAQKAHMEELQALVRDMRNMQTQLAVLLRTAQPTQDFNERLQQ